MKTVLNDRILFYDGTCQIPSDEIIDFIIRGVPIEKIAALERDDEVDLYNQLADVPLKHGDFHIYFAPDFTWRIPKVFKELDIASELVKLLKDRFQTVANFQAYKDRLEIELKEIETRNLSSMVKTLMFVMDYFKKNDIVYGVGRGSSCASLVLFLIGVHCIDPVKYDIPYYEFFHN